MFFFWESSALAEGAITSLAILRIAAIAANGSVARCVGTKPVCRTEKSSRQQQMLSPPVISSEL